MIVFDGNSLTQGVGAALGQSYPDQFRVLYPSIQTENRGVAGRTTQQLIDEFVVKIHTPFFRRDAEVVFFEYINSSATATDEITLIKTYKSQAESLGWRVHICTAPPSADSAATKINDTNILIRADSTFSSGLIDYASAPELQVAGNGANPTYYSDSKHLTQAGYAVLARVAYHALIE